jgi:hypothetical protein
LVMSSPEQQLSPKHAKQKNEAPNLTGALRCISEFPSNQRDKIMAVNAVFGPAGSGYLEARQARILLFTELPLTLFVPSIN